MNERDCTGQPRRRKRVRCDADLWGQGLTTIQRHTIRDVPLVGAYL